MKKITVLLASLLMIILAGCTSLTPKSGIEGKTYSIMAPFQNEDVTVTFKDGNISGLAGINRFTGSYTLQGEDIKVGPLAMTKMAGPDHLMKQEDNVSEVLSTATKLSVKGNILIITSKSGKSLTYILKK